MTGDWTLAIVFILSAIAGVLLVVLLVRKQDRDFERATSKDSPHD